MMGIVTIVADGVGLMIGSLLAAALASFAAWWLADRMRRPPMALLMLGVMVIAMLASPLEQSLFVRVFSVFCMVGMGMLWFVGPHGGVLPGVERESAGMAFPAAQDQ